MAEQPPADVGCLLLLLLLSYDGPALQHLSTTRGQVRTEQQKPVLTF